MHYKTIVLGLLEDRPALYEHLRSSNALLSTMNTLAVTLRDLHLSMLETLQQHQPETSPEVIKAESLEVVIEEIRHLLSQVDVISNSFSLDEAISTIRQRLA